jgi:hypothetical protein
LASRIPKELVREATKSARDAPQVHEADIALAALDAADVGSVKT